MLRAWLTILLLGMAASADAPAAGEYIKVEIRGILRGGLMAIGGETTGYVITSRGVTWELDFGGDAAMQKQADALDGKTALVTGTLEARPGVEIKTRTIVTVRSVAPATSETAAR